MIPKIKLFVLYAILLGLYPGRCCPVPAREATHAEMEMVSAVQYVAL